MGLHANVVRRKGSIVIIVAIPKQILIASSMGLEALFANLVRKKSIDNQMRAVAMMYNIMCMYVD
jgi:hypothetical protein